MDEQLRIKVDGSEQVFEKRDALLYTYAGELACYNHVFLVCRENNEEPKEAIYMFQTDSLYEEVADYMQRHDYPQHLNLTHVADTDVQAFEYYNYTDLRESETIPDAWYGIGE